MEQIYKTCLEDITRDITDEVIVTSTGYISRELYWLKDRPRNFYMMGSMGMALAIGLGIAYQKPDLKVIVISGDGAVLMSLGTLILHKQLVAKGMENLTHYILDNNAHRSTGGQSTASEHAQFNLIGPFEYTKVMPIKNEKRDVPRIPLLPAYITERFKNAIIRQQEK